MIIHNRKIMLSFEQQAALDAMLAGKNIFLTGKAGTGKSLVIHEFIRQCKRRFVCLAPTGLAALALQGMTVHRFFNFPITVVNETTINPDKLNLRLLHETEVVVIDEVSLLRSDLFQSIDYILRLIAPEPYKNHPFGNKQIIVIGDFGQLSPVVKEPELKRYLDEQLGGIYAFQTSAWANAKFENIVLHHVYRQKEEYFVDILDAIRTGETLIDDVMVIAECWLKHSDLVCDTKRDFLAELNDLCFYKKDQLNHEAINLCTTRAEADRINQLELEKLPGMEFEFQAQISGDFPSDVYPTNKNLRLRLGCRVMLLNNKYEEDGECRYVNGDTGVIEDFLYGTQPEIVVRLDKGKIVRVTKNTWENYRYELDIDDSGKTRIIPKVVGYFSQLPIMHGNALTVHKAQGMSIEKVNIIRGVNGFFTSGHLYCAVSRCRSLKGLTLDRPVEEQDVIVNETVMNFYHKIDWAYEHREAYYQKCEVDRFF